MSKQPQEKKQPNKFILLTGIGLQMGITIYLAVYVGKKLDEQYPSEKNWYTIIFTLLGVGVALTSLIIQVNRINKE